jgi:hypothetical protein
MHHFLSPTATQRPSKILLILLTQTSIAKINSIQYCINALPLLFKALLHGQKGCVFFQWAFKYIGNQERFTAFRPARDI